jgi:hypothetical protein
MASNICQDAAQCELAFDGRCRIAASVLWLIAGATALILKPSDRLIPVSTATAVYSGAPAVWALQQFGRSSSSGAPAVAALSAPVQETIATIQNKDGSTTKTRTTTNSDGTPTSYCQSDDRGRAGRRHYYFLK